MEINVKDLPGSIAGGGRYDNLIGMFLGAKCRPAAFRSGSSAFWWSCRSEGCFRRTSSKPPSMWSSPRSTKSALLAAMETAAELRRAGDLRVDLYPEVAKKMDKVFKHVDQRQAKFIAILGSDEVAAGTVTVRNVATRTKETMPRAEAASFIRRALSD